MVVTKQYKLNCTKSVAKKIASALALVVVMANISACSNSAKNEQTTDTKNNTQAVNYDVVSVSSINTSDELNVGFVSYDGTVEAVKNANISAQVSGVIKQLNVAVGSQVKKGQVIARIDNRSATSQVTAMQSQVDATKAQLNVASKNLNRQQQLYAKNYISKAALERAQAEFDSVKAQVNALNAQVNATQVQQGYFTITAPFSGVVSEVNVVVGDMAAPGMTLIQMYQPNNLRVVVDLPQSQAHNIALKDTTSFDVSFDVSSDVGLAGGYKAQVLKAELLPVSNTISHTRTLRLYLANPSSGGSTSSSIATPGASVKVSIPTKAGQDNALEQAYQYNNDIDQANSTLSKRVFIPTQAIIRHGDMVGVFVIGTSGKPLLRQIRVGKRFGDKTEVLSGLELSDKISLSPQKAITGSHAN